MLPDQLELFKKYAQTKDIKIRNRLAILNDPFAKSRAIKFKELSTEPLEDLIQVARIALINSIEQYDINNGAPFVAFAKIVIDGALKNHMRDKVPVVRSRHLQSMKQRIKKAEINLTEDLGRIPKVTEVAEAIGKSPEELRQIKEKIANLKVVSQEGLAYREPTCNSGIDHTFVFRLHNLRSYELEAIELLFDTSRSPKLETVAEKLGVTLPELNLRLRSAFENIEVCA